MDLSIVVLAAGQGTRMKSSLPKVLQTIGGKPMLVHVIQTAEALKPKQIIVVHGHGSAEVKQTLENFDVQWVEQEKRLGTGDAVKRTLPLISPENRVLILYGDVPLIAQDTLRRLLNAAPKDSVGLLTVNASDPTGLGRIIRNEKGKIERIVEERDANDIERQIHEVNTGIFVVKASLLMNWLPKLEKNNAQSEFYLTDIVQMAVKDKFEIVTAVPSVAEEVLGVNDKSQQVTAERHYQRHLAEKLLRDGVWICDPSRFDLRGTLQASEDVTIDVNVVIEGKVKIGKGSTIGPNCVLIDSEIGDGVNVLANSYLENVSINNQCVIGPYARLRPGTVLGENVKVGNFVEVKNTKVSKGSKISHLSYVGDATIGKNVNIGAGTITCNYDGANKHNTIIEDDVLIGSDTQLIAPVKVGRGATIAAGSTLRKDAPEDKLTITHNLKFRQVIDWQRPTKKASSSQPFQVDISKSAHSFE